ncbi:hypothetical protein LJK88_45580 [Paenibacillus sp. P26]|nr:hypothetical protein LJK88_45580 [Paenibacillus sp. P26]
MDSRLQSYLAEHRDRHLAEVIEFVRIPSVSSSTEHKPDMTRAAEWLAEALRKAGLENVQVADERASGRLRRLVACSRTADGHDLRPL